MEMTDALFDPRDEDRLCREQLTAAFARLSRTYELILHAAAEGIFSLDLEGRIAFANPAASRLLDWPAEDMQGRTVCEVVHGPGGHCGQGCPLAAPRLAEESRRRDIFVTRTGSGVVVEYSLALIREDEQCVGAVLVFGDITERERTERALAAAQAQLAARNRELQRQATHDPLTGLPNRSLLMDRLEQAIARAGRDGGRFAVCFLDLDKFKEINDSLGHAAGDNLLRATAQRLSACLRDGDTVARVGGDEFVLILADGGGSQAAPAMRRVAAAVSRPLQLGGGEIGVGCSIGASFYPEDGDRVESLLAAADAAMYRNKKARRG